MSHEEGEVVPGGHEPPLSSPEEITEIQITSLLDVIAETNASLLDAELSPREAVELVLEASGPL